MSATEVICIVMDMADNKDVRKKVDEVWHRFVDVLERNEMRFV